MPVDNGDASFSGFALPLINRLATGARLVDNPMDNRHIALIQRKEFGELLPRQNRG